MRILLIILFLSVTVNAYSADIYIREDGGTPTECDGTVDAPKNETKKCALKSYWKSYKFDPNNQTSVLVRKGTFEISVQPPSLWVTLANFNKNPDFYIKAAKSGRKVYISDLDGIAWQLELRKY